MVAAPLTGIIGAFPAFEGLLSGAATPAIERSSGEMRYRLSPPSPDRVSMEPPRQGIAARDLGRDLSAVVDERGAIWIEDTRGGVRVKVRRGEDSAPTTTLDGTAVAIRGAWRGADAFTFTKGRGVEDLVLARRGSADIAYSFDLPPKWHLAAPPPTPGLVQVLDERGAARLRFRVGKSLDQAGREVSVRPRIDGSTVHLEIGEVGTWPVLIDPEFETTGTMATPRVDHSSTRLPDGRVLLVGGRSESGTICDTLDSMEIFDPATVTFTVLEQPMSQPRRWHTATPLPNGHLLISGGVSKCCGEASSSDNCEDHATSSLELFHPDSGKTEPSKLKMNAPRFLHTATLLDSEGVLFAGGGVNGAAGTLERLSISDVGGSVDIAPMGNAGSGFFRSATWSPGDRVFLEWSNSKSVGPEGITTFELSGGSLSGPNLDEEGAIPIRHTATLLPNGDVLFVEASSSPGELNAAILDLEGNSVQGLAPKATPVETSLSGANSSAPRNHTATLLPDGRVLLVGGRGVSAAAVYEPATQETKSRIVATHDSMQVARDAPLATLLLDGSVLVTGGCLPAMTLDDQCAETRATGEVFGPSPDEGRFVALKLPIDGSIQSRTMTPLLQEYRVFIRGEQAALVCTFRSDPAEDTCSKDKASRCWKVSDELPTRAGHTTTLLANGKVLIAGGASAEGPLATIETFLPDQCGSVSQIGEPGMFIARARHTATLLPDGVILFVGGEGEALEGKPPAPGNAEVHAVGPDATERRLLPTSTRRFDHTATLLLDGTVLVAGGVAKAGGPRLKTAEIYDPTRLSFQPTGDLVHARKSHSATLLPDGRVLFAGGTEGESRAEIYNPADHQFSSLAAQDFPNPMAASRATVLPSGRVLIASVRDSVDAIALGISLYDPLSGSLGEVTEDVTWTSVVRHSQVLLPDGGVAFLGEDQDGSSKSFVWYGPSENHPGGLQITSVDVTCDPSCEVTGCLAGSTDGSSGITSASSTRLPAAVWMRIPDGLPIAGGLADFKKNHTPDGKRCAETATYHPPPTLLRGPGYLFVNGGNSRSVGYGFSMPEGHDDGTKCSVDAECSSGACVDDHCCDSRCDGACAACNIRGKEGICSPVTTAEDGEICDGCDKNADCPAGEVCLAPEQEGSDRRRCGPPPAEIGCSVTSPGVDPGEREALLYAVIMIVTAVAGRRRGRNGWGRFA